MQRSESETQREVARLVLERERELMALERLLGSDALPAVKTLAADGIVVRCGELVWASSALSRLDELGRDRDNPSDWYAPAMPDRSRSRPRDPNELGKLIVDLATGEAEEPALDTDKNAAAVELGRRGGLKGGRARAAKMTPEERSQSARNAAKARWKSRPKDI